MFGSGLKDQDNAIVNCKTKEERHTVLTYYFVTETIKYMMQLQSLHEMVTNNIDSDSLV